jgi:hypothetical protein
MEAILNRGNNAVSITAEAGGQLGMWGGIIYQLGVGADVYGQLEERHANGEAFTQVTQVVEVGALNGHWKHYCVDKDDYMSFNINSGRNAPCDGLMKRTISLYATTEMPCDV